MDALFQIFLPHYGPTSRSYATSTQGTDYGGVSEAAGALARAECHSIYTATSRGIARIPSWDSHMSRSSRRSCFYTISVLLPTRRASFDEPIFSFFFFLRQHQQQAAQHRQILHEVYLLVCARGWILLFPEAKPNPRRRDQ